MEILRVAILEMLLFIQEILNALADGVISATICDADVFLQFVSTLFLNLLNILNYWARK